MKANTDVLTHPQEGLVIFDELAGAFQQSVSSKAKPELYCFSPGRLNLIGEHIDYCGGHVMPAAISMGTYAVCQNLLGKDIEITALNFDERKVFSLENTAHQQSDGWLCYPKGVLHLMRQSFPGKIEHGLRIFVKGNLPLASGLSSSASFLLCFIETVKTAYGLRFSDDPQEDRRLTAYFAKRVENEYVGLQCGIMDQGSVVFGRKGHFMLMDCSKLAIRHLPFLDSENLLVIADTCKPRKLSESKYNERYSETRQALEAVRTKFPVQELCEITPEKRDEALDLIQSPLVRKRARHVIDENFRVFQAEQALLSNDSKQLGEILTAGHRSLREDFEVTGKELDSMFARALEQPGVLGARMTGAGFSGSALILLEKERASEILSAVAAGYQKDTGYSPAFYPFESQSGVHCFADVSSFEEWWK